MSEETICTNPYHSIPVIPKTGTLTFKHNDADDALATIKSLLSNTKVNVTVSWEVIPDKAKSEDLKRGIVAGTYAVTNDERRARLGTKG